MAVVAEIQLFEGQQVRYVWDGEQEKYFFSVVDVIKVLTDSENPRKYWSVLKTRLKKTSSELTTKCSQLKLTASDGKKYATDCFAQSDILELVTAIPSRKSRHFLDWFTYSENTIDGQSVY